LTQPGGGGSGLAGCGSRGGNGSLACLALHLDSAASALREEHCAFGQFADGLGGRVNESIHTDDLRNVMRPIFERCRLFSMLLRFLRPEARIIASCTQSEYVDAVALRG
jgi:hypothetical protein